MYYCLFCDVYLTLTFLLYQPDALHVRLVVFNWLVDWLIACTFILTCTFVYIVCAVTSCRFLLTLNGSHFVIYSALLLQILIISVFIFQIRDIYQPIHKLNNWQSQYIQLQILSIYSVLSTYWLLTIHICFSLRLEIPALFQELVNALWCHA